MTIALSIGGQFLAVGCVVQLGPLFINQVHNVPSNCVALIVLICNPPPPKDRFPSSRGFCLASPGVFYDAKSTMMIWTEYRAQRNALVIQYLRGYGRLSGILGHGYVWRLSIKSPDIWTILGKCIGRLLEICHIITGWVKYPRIVEDYEVLHCRWTIIVRLKCLHCPKTRSCSVWSWGRTVGCCRHVLE